MLTLAIYYYKLWSRAQVVRDISERVSNGAYTAVNINGLGCTVSRVAVSLSPPLPNQ